MKPKELETSAYITDDYIIEEVYDYYLQPEIQLAVFDRMDKTVSYSPELKCEDGSVIKPLQMDLIRTEQVRLPSQASEYIDELRLIEEIEQFISYYLDLPHPFYLKLVSHYILLTWVYDKLSVVPYLRALGDYGSGKTRFAQVIGSLCYKPLFVAGATSDSFIFRMIEIFKGTLILNELERVNTDMHNQLTIILNNGYEKGLGVGRVEGERKREPKMFDVYSPKIITSRTKFKDLALESRILSIPMKPTKRKDIPSQIDESFWLAAKDIRNKLLMYRFRNRFAVELENKEEKLWVVEPRLRQTLLPLFYVIQDKETEQEFIKYALEFQEQVISDRGTEVDAIVAEKLLDLLDNNEKVTVKDVAEKVNKEFDEKERITSKAVGKIIRGFGYKPKRIQGVYRIPNDSSACEYIKERYGLGKETTSDSPLNHQSLPNGHRSEVDLVDIGDINKEENIEEGGEEAWQTEK